MTVDEYIGFHKHNPNKTWIAQYKIMDIHVYNCIM